MILLLNIILIICLFIISKIIVSRQIARKMKKQLFCVEKEDSNRLLGKNDCILKIICSVVIAFIAILAGNGITKSILCGIFMYLIIKGYETIRKNMKKKGVLQDLLNVSECLRVQISSNISLGVALKNIPELCKNKEFAAMLTNLYLEYELSKFTVSNSVKELEVNFNYPETKMFISAINQQMQHTSALEAFDNLIEVLKEKYIEYMEENTKTKSLIMIFGVCLVVFNLAVMSIYPIIIEASEALKVMLM